MKKMVIWLADFKKSCIFATSIDKNLKFEMIMKTKKCNFLISAVLMMGIATMMTGCVKEDIASNDNGGGTNPTDMNVAI